MAFVEESDREHRLRLFLAELAVLREEYGMEIGGCGECGSPFVHDVRAAPTDDPVGRWLHFHGGRYFFRQGSISD